MRAALADDFDMPGALDAVMELVRHGNRQLQARAKVWEGSGPHGGGRWGLLGPHRPLPVTRVRGPQEPGGPRSAAVFGALVSFLEDFFELLGVSLAGGQVGLSR